MTNLEKIRMACGIMVAVFSGCLLIAKLVKAQDPACYIENESGQIDDLTEICGNQPPHSNIDPELNDPEFVREREQLAKEGVILMTEHELHESLTNDPPHPVVFITKIDGKITTRAGIYGRGIPYNEEELQ